MAEQLFDGLFILERDALHCYILQSYVQRLAGGGRIDLAYRKTTIMCNQYSPVGK